jgi:hypothetical protein
VAGFPLDEDGVMEAHSAPTSRPHQERVEDMIERLEGPSPPTAEAVARLLTEGYATAHALEAECLRLERREHDLTSEGVALTHAVVLARRLNASRGELRELRAALRALYERADGRLPEMIR